MLIWRDGESGGENSAQRDREEKQALSLLDTLARHVTAGSSSPSLPPTRRHANQCSADLSTTKLATVPGDLRAHVPVVSEGRLVGKIEGAKKRQ